jgi:hypothetical protein
MADDESENLSPRVRSAPLISHVEPDFVARTLLAAMVTLLGFICYAAWSGNRELGEMRAEYRANTEATERRITAFEMATERRLSALEQRVWKGE